MALKEDYLDDILDTSVNEKRKYRMINNADGTISLEDVTDYSQNGDNFGASDINITNKTVNELIAMGLNVRCNADGYLEVFVDGAWEQTPYRMYVSQYPLFMPNNNIAEFATFSGAIPQGSAGGIITGTLTIGDVLNFVAGSTNGVRTACIISKVYDLTNYDKIVLTHTTTAAPGPFSNAKLFVTKTKATSMTPLTVTTLISENVSASEGTVELDIRNISGDCYIGIQLCNNVGNVSVKISEFYLA